MISLRLEHTNKAIVEPKTNGDENTWPRYDGKGALDDGEPFEAALGNNDRSAVAILRGKLNELVLVGFVNNAARTMNPCRGARAR